jgi:transcriptional regulator with XRE-family HTH domain
MDDDRLGRAVRLARVRARLRQVDIARATGVARTTVIEVEAGRLGRVRVADLRAIADGLGLRLALDLRWQGADLDRLLAAGHARLHELVADLFASLPGWVVVPEVSFAVFGERGVIDVIGWHAASRSLLIIELKTALGDPQQLTATMDRRVRLATRIVAERGWRPTSVSAWVVLDDTRTNRRRVAAHRGLLRARFPRGGREVRAWLKAPSEAIMGLSFLTDVADRDRTAQAATRRRIRQTKAEGARRGSRSQGVAAADPT